jgi:uncharacterized protein (DUF58 family)
VAFTAAALREILPRLGRVSVAARQAVEPWLAGIHPSPRRGLSVAFAGHRPYLPGDDPRLVDWLVWARSDRLDVRLYEEETRLRALVVVDVSGSLARPGCHDQVRTLAAALAVLMANQEDAVGLALVDRRVRTLLPPQAGPGALLRVLAALEQAAPAGATDLGAALAELAPRLRRRGLVVVLGDVLDDPARVLAGLRLLRHRRQDVRLLAVHDADQVSFPFAGEVRFTGLEGESSLDLDADRTRAAYLRAHAAHMQALSAGCHAAGIPFTRIDADEDPAAALLRALGHAA